MLKQYLNTNIEAGCDEAGRGCLAGPVVASAVIFPNNFKNNWINDSKKLSEKKRNELIPIIKREAVCYSIGVVSVKEIDKWNILRSSFIAMHRAINKLSVKPESLIIDGNRFVPYPNIKHTCIIKGDSKYLSIAAASILAKNYRDKLMINLHKEYSNYKWDTNKGYPTNEHRLNIKKYGITKYHRKSFQLIPKVKQTYLNL